MNPTFFMFASCVRVDAEKQLALSSSSQSDVGRRIDYHLHHMLKIVWIGRINYTTEHTTTPTQFKQNHEFQDRTAFDLKIGHQNMSTVFHMNRLSKLFAEFHHISIFLFQRLISFNFNSRQYIILHYVLIL